MVLCGGESVCPSGGLSEEDVSVERGSRVSVGAAPDSLSSGSARCGSSDLVWSSVVDGAARVGFSTVASEADGFEGLRVGCGVGRVVAALSGVMPPGWPVPTVAAGDATVGWPWIDPVGVGPVSRAEPASVACCDVSADAEFAVTASVGAT